MCVGKKSKKVFDHGCAKPVVHKSIPISIGAQWLTFGDIFYDIHFIWHIFFLHRFFCKFENGPHPVMAHLNYDVWFHITSYYICVNWLLIHNTVIASDFMVCAIFFFSFRCLFHHTAYLRKSTDNKTIRCLFVLIFVVGSFVPKLECVSYEGIESKTVISNRCCYLYVYVWVSPCALCVNKYYFHL